MKIKCDTEGVPKVYYDTETGKYTCEAVLIIEGVNYIMSTKYFTEDKK